VHDLGGNVPAQLAAAELVPRLDELSARQAPARQARHDHLRAELARHLPGWNAPPVPGGQTLWVRLPYGDGTSFAQTALRHRVSILPGSSLDASGQSQDYLRLHFVARADELTEAVKRLADAWRAYRPPPSHLPPCPSDGAATAATTQRQRLCSRTFARQNKARLPAESRDPSFDPTIRRGTPDPCPACLICRCSGRNRVVWLSGLIGAYSGDRCAALSPAGRFGPWPGPGRGVSTGCRGA
jgi:hypothetical protein